MSEVQQSKQPQKQTRAPVLCCSMPLNLNIVDSLPGPNKLYLSSATVLQHFMYVTYFVQRKGFHAHKGHEKGPNRARVSPCEHSTTYLPVRRRVYSTLRYKFSTLDWIVTFTFQLENSINSNQFCFSMSDLLDKPGSQIGVFSSLLPPWLGGSGHTRKQINRFDAVIHIQVRLTSDS